MENNLDNQIIEMFEEEDNETMLDLLYYKQHDEEMESKYIKSIVSERNYI
jgi:hypothetical protein